jgi:polysaccharide biosynthesis/export protein
VRPSFTAVAACLLLAASALPAQQLPTPDQARRLLETRPDLAGQIRREIAGSGLTPDQIRARLRAAGYPAALLDAYLGGRGATRDTLGGARVSSEVLDAVAALGITDSVDTSELRATLRARARGVQRDTLGALDDSLARSDTLADSAAAGDSLDERLAEREPTGGRGAARPRRTAAVDTGATIFGLSVFADATTQFDPNLAGPVDASYRLGPGDRLVLLITGDAERAHTLDVTREGFVVVPGVGEIPVANLTLGQLEELLYARLGRVYSGLRRGAGATHSNQVFVLGDVAQPGSYRVSSAGTALTALYAAGGPTPNGSLRRVEIRRAGRLVDTLDLYDYLLRADGSHDPRLQSGDVVFVPVHGPRVRVHGAVVRPATYELRGAETLAELLGAAGGFTPEATRRRVQISRILPPTQRDTTDRARVVLDIGLVDVTPEKAGGATGTGPALALEPGDVVQVFRVAERVGRRVAVRGDVWSPGVLGFTPGMRLSDAIRLAGGIRPDAYLGQVLITRLRGADSTRVQLRAALQDSTGRPVDDVVLREDDEIRVFSITDLRPAQYVAITGAVRRGGRYAYREGMTVRDLVLLAGGLDERAYLGSAEIARLPASRDGGRLAVSHRVSLDSSYLLARERNVRYAARGTDAQADLAPEVPLEPYDNVLILAQPDWERPRRVVVTGEVRFPGAYTLTSKTERLGDVIARAGGPTGAAYADGVAFYRAQGDVGRVGVDLRRVLRDASYRDNLLLQDGDSIHLPPFAGIVEVQGAVNAPRGVAYVPGADLGYYVRAAGGAVRTADLARSYVTQPDGSVESVVARRFLPDAVPTPRPGSVVYVVKGDQPARTDNTARLAVIAQVIGALVTLVVVSRQR